METTWRWSLLTAIAPVAWGASYYVTGALLPADHPFWGGVLRALPAGLLLLAIRPRRPRGAWWWRAAILGSLTMGLFFVLIYLASQLLPTSIAAMIMATSPVAMMLVAWLLIGERPRLLMLLGAALGLGGVAVMLISGGLTADPLGVLASLAAMLISAVCFVLSKRWSAGVDVLAATSWQLIAGGLVMLPIAALVEGPPPALDAGALLGFGFLSVIGTALAFSAWFTGLARLPVGTVGVIGLLNPVTGLLLGILLAGERFSAQQIIGVILVFAGILLAQRRPAARGGGNSAPPRLVPQISAPRAPSPHHRTPGGARPF